MASQSDNNPAFGQGIALPEQLPRFALREPTPSNAQPLWPPPSTGGPKIKMRLTHGTYLTAGPQTRRDPETGAVLGRIELKIGDVFEVEAEEAARLIEYDVAKLIDISQVSETVAARLGDVAKRARIARARLYAQRREVQGRIEGSEQLDDGKE